MGLFAGILWPALWLIAIWYGLKIINFLFIPWDWKIWPEGSVESFEKWQKKLKK